MINTWTSLPRRVRWPLVSALALLVVLSTLYIGYCYGWWGRSNLVLQYLLQCHSPPGSEQVRYREFTVLAPACRWPEVEAMSGDGRYLLITEHAAPATTYRLDLTTGERQLLPFDPTWGNDPAASNLWFLTTDLVLALVKGQRYVLMDVPSGRRVFVHWQYADTLATAPQDILHDAQHIIIAATAAVVLAPDPFARPDHNLVFYSASLDPGEFQARLRAVGVPPPSCILLYRTLKWRLMTMCMPAMNGCGPIGRAYTRQEATGCSARLALPSTRITPF